MDLKPYLGRATGLAKQMAHMYLNAAMFRVVWAMPMVRVLIIAGAVFLALSYFG